MGEFFTGYDFGYFAQVEMFGAIAAGPIKLKFKADLRFKVLHFKIPFLHFGIIGNGIPYFGDGRVVGAFNYKWFCFHSLFVIFPSDFSFLPKVFPPFFPNAQLLFFPAWRIISIPHIPFCWSRRADDKKRELKVFVAGCLLYQAEV